MSGGMVPFPMEKRGEAVHAVGARHFIFRNPQEGPAGSAAHRTEHARLEPGYRASAVGIWCSDKRGDPVARHFTQDASELEVAVVEASTLWAPRWLARGTAASNVQAATADLAAGGSPGSATSGVCLQPMDRTETGGIRLRSHGGSGDTRLDHGVASAKRIRVETNQANDAQPAESLKNGKGLESPPEAKKRASQPGARFELWFADGVRFELLPVTTYTYRERGRPLLIPTPGKNYKVAVCGAMRWPDGPFVFADGTGYPNTTLFIRMLLRLRDRARRIRTKIVLVLDNGSAHTSRLSRTTIDEVKEFIQVFWLPTYTSEQLNDIEGLWKHIKEDYFSRMLVGDSRRFRKAVVALLRRMSRARGLRRVLKPCHDSPVRKNLLVPA